MAHQSFGITGMIFAYADPPYYQQGRKKYAPYHDDVDIWDQKETHIELIYRLRDDFPDGWVMSCNPQDLLWMTPHLPEDIRICAWTKTFHQIRPTTVQYAWEAVLLSGGRKVYKRKPMVRDWLSWPISIKKGLPGAKPLPFNTWVLQLLNYQEGDELVDLFPGTSSMQVALDQYQSAMPALRGEKYSEVSMESSTE